MIILGEKLYTKYDVCEILSENEKLKCENDELQRLTKSLLNKFPEFYDFCKGLENAHDTIVIDSSGVYIRTIHGAFAENKLCDCGKLREKIDELRSQIADMTKQYDSLRGEYEMACLEREHLAKQLDDEKERYNVLFQSFAGVSEICVKLSAEISRIGKSDKNEYGRSIRHEPRGI